MFLCFCKNLTLLADWMKNHQRCLEMVKKNEKVWTNQRPTIAEKKKNKISTNSWTQLISLKECIAPSQKSWSEREPLILNHVQKVKESPFFIHSYSFFSPSISLMIRNQNHLADEWIRMGREMWTERLRVLDRKGMKEEGRKDRGT